MPDSDLRDFVDRLLRKLLNAFNWYENKRWDVSRSVGRVVFGIVTRLGKESEKGLLFRRAHRRLRNRYHQGTIVPSRYFRDFDSVSSVFTNAFHYRFYPYTKILLVVFVVMLADYRSTCSVQAPHMSLYAAILMLIGTLIFSRGLFQGYLGLSRGASNHNHTENYEILDEIPANINWNTLVSLAYSSADAVWATVFVMLGFGFTVLATFPVTSPIPC